MGDKRNIINPEDQSYYDDKLYKVGIWPGAGYQLNTYYVYANNEETALDLVVVYLEIHNPSLLSSVQEVEDRINEDYQTEFNNFIVKGEDNDIITFASDYLNLLYIDATMNGATQPYFIESENLVVEEVNKDTELQENADIKKYVSEKVQEDVSDNETQIANWIKDTVEDLKENEAGCGTWKLDDRLAICVGWSDGYDKTDIDDNYIHSKEDPTYCINAAIKVWTSDDMRTDLDWISFPYDDENVYDDSYTISKNENYNELAKSLLHVYSTYKDCEIDKDGKITSRPVEENKSIKAEAKLTDYLGILQIRDILQKNPETANKEFAIKDNMIVEVGVGNDVSYYKATKNADDEWELTKVNNENENLTESINEDGFPNSKELQDYFEKLNDLPDTIELDNRQYKMTEYGGTGSNSWAVYTDTLNDYSYIRVYYSLGHISDGHYKGIKSINGVSDLRESKQVKTEYYNKLDDEKVIWSSEFDIDNTDKEDLKNNQYQDYLDNFNSTVTPMSYDEWLDSDECSTYFDLEWEDAAHQDDTYADWYSFITDYVSDEEKQEAYNEYVESCKQTTLEPDTFEKWLDNQYNQLADNAWETQREDLEQNILPSIDTQLNDNVLILSGYYGSNYPDFKSSGNGSKMFEGIDEFVDYMGGFDETEITSKQGILGAILSDHDGTVSGQFYTLPADKTELIKALDYENIIKDRYDEENLDNYNEQDLMETEFNNDLMYGGLEVQDLTSHLDLLVPIKDTISGYTPDEPKGNKTESKENNSVEELLDLLDKVNIKNKQRAFCEFTGISKAQLDGSQGFNEENAKIFIPKVKEWLSKQESVNVLNCNNIKKVEAVEYISKQDYDKIPDDYKTTIAKTLKARQAVGDNAEELRKLYKELGYDEEDPMIMANEKGETILKPVKVQEEKTIATYKDNSSIVKTIQADNGKYFNYYYDNENDKEHWSSSAGPFNTSEEAETMAKKHRPEIKKENKSNIETVYVPEKDMTIIFEETTDDNDNPTSTEIKGFYYGSPSDDETKKFTGKLKATYDTIQESKTLVEDDTDPEEVANEIQTARENSENDTLSIEQIASSLDVLLVDEQGAIDGYKSYLEQAKQVVSEELYNSIDTQIQEIIKDEKDHIVKLNTMKDTLLGNTDNIPAIDIENVDDEENLVVEENKQVTEASSNTIKEELNTGILPVVNVDMYSLSDNLYEYDIDQKELDDIVLEIAPKYIEDTLSEILPNVSVIAKSVYHPKQYNYSGDELEFDLVVDSNAYEELKEKTLNNPEFKQFLKDNYSSRSGFVSFMADDLDDFETQEEWKQMVQVIMFNIPEDRIELNNDQYITEFMDNVSMNYAPVDDDNDNITEAKEPETNQDTIEYKVGDVVEDIVDGDTAVIEAITDNPKTYLLRFVDGECEGEAYKYAEGRFELVTDEARINKAKETYENGTKKIESLLKENADSKEELQVKIESIQNKITGYKEAYRKGTMPRYQYNYLSCKEEAKLKDLKTTLNNID